MSLKGFHILFVVMASALSLVFGVWAWQAYRATDAIGYALGAFGAFAAMAALGVYGVAVYRKLGKMGVV